MKESRVNGELKVEYTYQDLVDGRYFLGAINEKDVKGNIIHKCKDSKTGEPFDIVIPIGDYKKFIQFKKDHFHRQVNLIVDHTKKRIKSWLDKDPAEPQKYLEKQLKTFSEYMVKDDKTRRFTLPNGKTIILENESNPSDRVYYNYQKIIVDNDDRYKYGIVSYKWAKEDFTDNRAVLAVAFYEIIEWLKYLAKRQFLPSEYRTFVIMTDTQELISLIDIGLSVDVSNPNEKEKLVLINQKAKEYTLGINPKDLFDLSLPSLIEQLKLNLKGIEPMKRKAALRNFEAYLEYRKQMELKWHESTSSGSILFSISKNSIENIKAHYQYLKDWIKDTLQSISKERILSFDIIAPDLIKDLHKENFLSHEQRLKEDKYIIDNDWNGKKVELIAFAVITWAKSYPKRYHPQTEKKIEFKDWITCLELRYNTTIGDQKKRSKILSTFGNDYKKLRDYSPFWLFDSLPNSPDFPY